MGSVLGERGSAQDHIRAVLGEWGTRTYLGTLVAFPSGVKEIDFVLFCTFLFIYLF